MLCGVMCYCLLGFGVLKVVGFMFWLCSVVWSVLGGLFCCLLVRLKVLKWMVMLVCVCSV